LDQRKFDWYTEMQTQERWFRYKAAFELMDDEAQELIARIAEQYARDWPAQRPKPKLTLVTQDLDSRTLGSGACGGDNGGAPAIRRKAVQIK
jgi:hypothetical protein